MPTRLKLIAGLGLAGCLFFGSAAIYESPLERWSTVLKVPTPNLLTGVAYGDGNWVAAGFNYIGEATMLRSTNGIDWVSVESGTAKNLRGVGFGASGFVAVGDSGGEEAVVLRSADGLDWREQSSGVTNGLSAVTYGNGLWVACGDRGTVITSPGGTNWTARNSGTAERLLGVTHEDGMFVVVGEGGTILTSTDGEEWLAADSGTTRPLYSVAASSGSFVAVGGGLGIGFQVILRSEDGRTWSPQTVPDIPDMFAPLQGVAHGGQEWRAVGRSGGALVSTDGMHWEKVITGTKGELTGIGYGHGRFVAVGGVLSDAGLLLTSLEGGPWQVVIDAPRTYRSAAYGNGVFVIAGSEGLLRSTDGTNWVREVYPVLPGNLMQPLNDVVFANGLFVAVGDLGTIVHSTDGSRWERTDFGVENINGLVYGDGKFVAVTSLGITGALSCVSTNGIDWTAYGTGEIGVLRAIAFGNGRFVATGEGGLFMHSTNGQEWTLVEDDDIGGWITFPGVAYGNGRFVAVGYGEGSIVVSENGIEWEEIAAVDVADVGFAEGWFVAVAGEGEVIASRTGEFWYACRTNAGLQHVSYVPGKFLTMGVNLIMSSGWMGPSRLSAVGGEGMELMLAGEIGREYSLETSDRLTNGTWHTFARMIASNEVTKIPDLPSEEAIGFFRAGAMDYAPENITGGQVVATVFDGYGMLSASGVYRFSVTGNTYTITPISGPIAADSGVYGYQKVSGDVGVLTLTNSFGWVLRSEVYFSGRDFGEIETKILSSDAVGAQTGTFVME